MSEEADAVAQGREDGSPNQGKYNGIGIRGQTQDMTEVELTGLGT